MGKWAEQHTIIPDIKCSHCNKYKLASEFKDSNKPTICNECSKGIECSNCGYIEDTDCYHILEHLNEIVCDDCYDNCYSDCEHCSETFYIDDMISDNSIYLCEQCYSAHYTRCNDCDEIIESDYAEIFDDNEYCDWCYNRIQNPIIINSHGYKPEPIFKRVYRERKTKLYYGIELEVNNGGNSQEKAKKVQDITDDIYIKSDITVQEGFEIVSHPCTYKYHLQELPWINIMNKCSEMGYVSHKGSCCGMHIHVSKKYFGETEKEQDRTIKNLLVLVNLNLWNKIYKFSRRTKNTIKWGKRYTKLNSPMTLLNEGKRGYRGSVNLYNRNTIEFRFFRGTLDSDTFFANIQLTRILCELATSLKPSKIKKIKWKDILDYASANDFTEFMRYCSTRKLLIE